MKKSHDKFNHNGLSVEIGINNVMIFKFWNVNIEFWKDQEGQYHVGLVYHSNGEEHRYKHFQLGKEPKKWKETVKKLKSTYDELFPSINFTNYM